IFNSQTLSDTSAIKFSIMKKTVSIHSDIQCYYYKKKDHIARNCFMKQKFQQMITELIENDTPKSSFDMKNLIEEK
ncbi:hypothetical protein PAAG_12540, partial [Paracoccidioides lutzii Pb01]